MLQLLSDLEKLCSIRLTSWFCEGIAPGTWQILLNWLHVSELLASHWRKQSPFGVRLRFCKLRAYLYPVPAWLGDAKRGSWGIRHKFQCQSVAFLKSSVLSYSVHLSSASIPNKTCKACAPAICQEWRERRAHTRKGTSRVGEEGFRGGGFATQCKTYK